MSTLPSRGGVVRIRCWHCDERNTIWRGVFNFLCTNCGAMCWIVPTTFGDIAKGSR